MSLLEVSDLSKHFGGLVAVDELSFEVEDGEILGLIGPNGSGKTTVFNCIMGIYDVTDGAIHFDGEDSAESDGEDSAESDGEDSAESDGEDSAESDGEDADEPDGENITHYDTYKVVNRGIARVSQESNPIDLLSVGANIKLFTLPNSVLSLRGGASDTEIYGYAERVGLEDQVYETPDSLAHADVRRLEIAKALATEPDLLLLDEPFAGMNQAEIRELSEQIREFRDEGMSLIIVDHNMHGLMQLVDRVVVIANGEKLAEGAPEDIVENEAVQEAYLAGEEAGF